MRLPFLRSKPSPAEAASQRPDDGGPVEAARTRARQRLVGALVLLGAGVVSFPLLFDTQPRPVPPDIPIATPRDAVAGTGRGASRPLAPLPVLPADAGAEAAPAGAVTAAAAPAALPVPAGLPSDSTPAAGPAAVSPDPARTAAVPPVTAAAQAQQSEQAGGTGAATAPAAAPARPAMQAPVSPAPAGPAVAGTAANTATAAARPSSAASSPAAGRFVVQVGAFAEDRALREARQKAERLGLKTYVQVIDAEGARRTRVRVGPFDTREQAEATARKLKTGGLPAAILAL